MTQMIAIDANALDAVLVRLDRLERMLQGVTVQPKPEWVSVADYAKQINRCRKTVVRMIERGELETCGSGHNRQVRVQRAKI